MSKLCWKCNKFHEDGAKVCPYCGASFATDDMKYQSNGRTVSTTDDTAYLSSAPP
ncbi:MAG: zinc-ribbon domain-containing protein [Candidatus Methanomethylophilaceae archaeon]|nr:zinc-ribbon domain-containing protein [Candidatus Methanomethylophilaceae archaeon]